MHLIHFQAFLGIMLLFVVGCSGDLAETENKYNDIIRQAPDQISFVKEFDRLFPNNYNSISGFSARPGNQTLLLRAAIYDRYELLLYLDIQLDKDRRKLLGHGKPEFVLHEITSVKDLSGGRYYADYNLASHRKFYTREWARLVESNGDLSVLGIQVIKDKPVPGFADYWKSQAP